MPNPSNKLCESDPWPRVPSFALAHSDAPFLPLIPVLDTIDRRSEMAPLRVAIPTVLEPPARGCARSVALALLGLALAGTAVVLMCLSLEGQPQQRTLRLVRSVPPASRARANAVRAPGGAPQDWARGPPAPVAPSHATRPARSLGLQVCDACRRLRQARGHTRPSPSPGNQDLGGRGAVRRGVRSVTWAADWWGC